MKVTTIRKTIKIETYHLSKDIKYIKEYTNNREKFRYLVYRGKKFRGYDLRPVFNFDRSILKETNPYWDKWELLDQTHIGLPEPEDVDINKIILVQDSTYSFFDINLNPIPVVYEANAYHNGSLHDEHYDLKKLRDYLLDHPDIKYCSDIKSSSYSSDSLNKKWLEVLIYPDEQWLKDMYLNTKGFDLSYITGSPHQTIPDYLGIKQFENKIKKSWKSYDF
ncbi:MAG: hypothetical protein J5I47_06735 [Vicingus serpentipes]|nr:hypothetical protein [Vicingus serpentipes]